MFLKLLVVKGSTLERISMRCACRTFLVTCQRNEIHACGQYARRWKNYLQ